LEWLATIPASRNSRTGDPRYRLVGTDPPPRQNVPRGLGGVREAPPLWPGDVYCLPPATAPVWQRYLAVSNERIGDTERDLKHPDKARAYFERARVIYVALFKSNPNPELGADAKRLAEKAALKDRLDNTDYRLEFFDATPQRSTAPVRGRSPQTDSQRRAAR
jgi:hypothetical protein